MPDLRPATYRDIIAAEAKKARVPMDLALAMVDQESLGDQAAVSGKGARGFFQLMPGTAKELGVDPTDPIQNIQGGLTYFRQQLDRHNGDVSLALASYNAGPGAVAKAGGVPNYPETTDYVQRILGRLQPAPGTPPGAPSARGRQVAQPPPIDTRTAEEATGGPPQLPTLPEMAPGKASSPTSFERDPTIGQRAAKFGVDAASALDPRTPEGRRNLAGAGGAALAAGALVATAPASVPAAAVTGLAAGTAGVAGAFLGGELAEGGEQLVGTAPASSMAMLGAGAQQGGYEAAGQAFMWPIRALGRRLLATSVGRAATKGLQAARVATMARLDNALTAASEAAGDVKTLARQTVQYTQRRAGDANRITRRAEAEALRGVRKSTQAGVEQAARAGEALVGQAPDDVVSVARRQVAATTRGAQETAQAGVGVAEEQAAARTAEAAAPYEAMVAQPPSAALAGRAASAVVEGPATDARNIVGKQVEQAAKDAPPVDIKALKAEAQQVLERIAKPQRSFPRGTPEEAGVLEGASAIGPVSAETVAKLEQRAAQGDASAVAKLAHIQQLRADLDAAQAAAHQEVLKHPALGVIQRILNADDVVPFLDAHLWKSELQNSLQGTYDKVVRKQVTSITQKLAGGLREALAVHEPYNQATRAYAKIVPLYTKEYAALIRKTAVTDPEALVRSISADKPTAVRMLRDVLVTQSAEGGKAVEGQRAWDLVRSTWTHENVLKGGIDKLEGNLAKLPKEFADLFYGDESGQAVLQNLRTLSSAYKAAEQTGLSEIAAAKTAGEAGVEGARRAGESAIDQAMRARAGLQQQAAGGIAAARATGREAIERTQAAARTRVEATRRTGAAAVDQAELEAGQVRRLAAGEIRDARIAKRVGRAPTAEESRFAESSLRAGHLPTPEQIGADIARVGGLGIFQIWGGLSMMRLLRGPKSAELIEWAAYSPANTQWLVRMVTGPSPAADVVASGMRAMVSALSQPKVGEKPPAQSRARVGAPPPR